jgi:hypothetical protein
MAISANVIIWSFIMQMRRDMVSAGIVVVINLILDDPLFLEYTITITTTWNHLKNNRILIGSLQLVKDGLCPTLCSRISYI